MKLLLELRSYKEKDLKYLEYLFVYYMDDLVLRIGGSMVYAICI